MNFTPDTINKLEDYQLVVVGINTEGRHGKGFAKKCLDKNWGLVYGETSLIQGQCIAIITKNLRGLHKGLRSIPLMRIKDQIVAALEYAKQHPEKEILMTKIGTNNAGYTESEISDLFNDLQIPFNVRMPKFNIENDTKKQSIF